MENTPVTPPKLILLDVYETLLSMEHTERRVNDVLNSRQAYQLWFELFMEYCFVDNCTVQFNDFNAIAGATLKMAGQMLKKQINENDIQNILETLKHLPVKEGVQKGLSGLLDSGFRVAALTNSPEAVVKQRMQHTGLISYFETVLSAEHVKKYKPSVEVYAWAATKLQLHPSEIVLVSSHGWDIAGAENAGMKTAYLLQDKQVLYPLAPKPYITCKNLPDLVSQITALCSKTE